MLEDFLIEGLSMGVNHWNENAAILDALSSVNRLKTFYYLGQGKPPQAIAEDLDVTRSALQPYISDFKDTGILRSRGKEYELTEKGEKVVELVEQMDKLHTDLDELQEFLIENPEVIPEEVKEQIRREYEDEN